MYGATGNIYCGLHDFEEMSFLMHFLRAGDVFADVGVNVGAYSMLAASVGARAIAFEPAGEHALKGRSEPVRIGRSTKR